LGFGVVGFVVVLEQQAPQQFPHVQAIGNLQPSLPRLYGPYGWRLRTIAACNSACSHTAGSRSSATRAAVACGPHAARSQPRAGGCTRRAAGPFPRRRGSRMPVAMGDA
jgi:hypothetical protein